MAKSRICSIDGCGKPHLAKGYCSKHYTRLRLHGDPEFCLIEHGRVCSVPGCGNKHRAHGFCDNHANRYLKHGTPFGGRTAPGELKNWLIANSDKVDHDCFGWPYNRHPQHGYGVLGIGGKTVGAHAYMCELVNGPKESDELQAAHNCGNGWCLNPNHLRWATPKENQADRIDHGTDNRGSKHGASKYNPELVKKARELYQTMDASKVSEILGVPRTFVYSVANRQTWNWVP